MKKLRMSLLATLMLVGLSISVMAEDDCTPAVIAKITPTGYSPAVVAEPRIGLNKIDRKYAKLIEWGDAPALYAYGRGNTMIMAILNGSTTIYVATIGGSGGAPMSQTGGFYL